MSKPQTFQWPALFSGLQALSWKDLSRENSADITIIDEKIWLPIL